ncbi:Phosphoenolpyruvate carboxylase 1 [Platanthera guangdongensis]|uniref:Phosphoenolpyruvate carboxylase 1 n=1 Tax=Platanthera guangdongensis TaxID=2320717 RepID=A0ABR2LJP2_9ASPA
MSGLYSALFLPVSASFPSSTPLIHGDGCLSSSPMTFDAGNLALPPSSLEDPHDGEVNSGSRQKFWKKIPQNEPYRVIHVDVRDKLYHTQERAHQLLSNEISDIPEKAAFTNAEQVRSFFPINFENVSHCLMKRLKS